MFMPAPASTLDERIARALAGNARLRHAHEGERIRHMVRRQHAAAHPSRAALRAAARISEPTVQPTDAA